MSAKTVQDAFSVNPGATIEQSVWLVINVPFDRAGEIDELEKKLKDVAWEWVKNRTGNPVGLVSSGKADTKKLRIFVEERGAPR